MVSAIFQPEIDTLQTQIAQLQTQIAAAFERMKALGEAEFMTDRAIQSVQSALQMVSALAPSAIANLKSAVLDLFRGNDQPGSNDNQSSHPEPQLDNDGGAVVIDFAPSKYLNTSCPVYFEGYWDNFSVGDHVRSITTKSWEYVVTALRADGYLDCRRLNVSGSIEKVEKEVSAFEPPQDQQVWAFV